MHSYWLFQENPNDNISRFVLQESGRLVEYCLTVKKLVGVSWRVSDCEDLVRLLTGDDERLQESFIQSF